MDLLTFYFSPKVFEDVFSLLVEKRSMNIDEIYQVLEFKKKAKKKGDIIFETIKIMENINILRRENNILILRESVSTNIPRLEFLRHLRKNSQIGVKYIADIIDYYACPPENYEINLKRVFRNIRNSLGLGGEEIYGHEQKIEYLMRILRFTGVGIVRGSKKKPEVIAAIAPSLILDILKEYIKNTQSTSLMPFLLYVNTEYIKIFQGNNLGRPVKIALKKLYDLGYVRYEKVSDSSIPIDIFENGKPVDQVILLEKYKYDK